MVFAAFSSYVPTSNEFLNPSMHHKVSLISHINCHLFEQLLKIRWQKLFIWCIAVANLVFFNQLKLLNTVIKVVLKPKLIFISHLQPVYATRQEEPRGCFLWAGNQLENILCLINNIICQGNRLWNCRRLQIMIRISSFN